MRSLRSEPHSELQPFLIKVQPHSRPRNGVFCDESSIMPMKHLRMEQTQRAILMKVWSILVDDGIHDVHTRNFAAPVPNVDPIALPLVGGLQSPTEDAPTTSH